MADIFTAQRLQKFLRKKWKEAGCTLERRQRMGICTAQLTNHSAKRSRRLQDPHFDLWIAVYDEFVSWLVSLVTVAHWNNCKEPYEPTDYEKAIVLLLMRIVSDSLAIRHLMLLGFDAGAKTLVRSTTEHMEVMAAILDDPTMGIEFCKSRDEITANKFWKAYLSKHKVRPRIKNIWLKFFRGEHDAAKFFANWGSNDYPQLSAIAHPSFMGCVHAVIPAKASYSDEKWLGMWGDKSLASIGTVQTCLSPLIRRAKENRMLSISCVADPSAQAIAATPLKELRFSSDLRRQGDRYAVQTYISGLFPLILAIGDFPFGKRTKLFGRPRRYSPANELHKHIKQGRTVLGSLVLSLNAESNHPLIYPEVASLGEKPPR